MNELMKLITDHIVQIHGIDISKYDETFLNKSLLRRMKDTLHETEATYYSYLEQNYIESDMLLNSLQISYTEFFRNALTFSVLEKLIIPSIILNKSTSSRNEIRVWSAACATGQETYSLAMLLHELINCPSRKNNFRIFATDQSEIQINEAQSGQYHGTALNCLSLKRANHWFTKSGETYAVKPELKENIEFSVFDLLNETYSCPPTSIFGDFDIIVCANILFYYNPEFQNKIIKKIRNCLSDTGYLITGETERDLLIQSGFHEVYPLSAIFRI
jgi:chemotaxis protein methyltransferase CheR